nr:hypothetical protein [Isorropodon fossajaponicum symbiont]
MVRNSLKYVGYKDRKQVASSLKQKLKFDKKD